MLALRWGGFTCLRAQAEQFTVDLVKLTSEEHSYNVKEMTVAQERPSTLSSLWWYLSVEKRPRSKTCTSLLSFT